MKFDDDEITVNMFWLVAFFGLVITAIVPEILILPIVAVIALLGFKVYKKRKNMSFGDIATPFLALVVLVSAYAIPELILIGAGFTLAEAIDMEIKF